ncbi:MAG: hypothetical protein A3Q59_05205 [Methanomethylophilus alvi]|nr:MAG: hypothetical protein A3Q59_05205 [Methanomethylophilus alvi]
MNMEDARRSISHSLSLVSKTILHSRKNSKSAVMPNDIALSVPSDTNGSKIKLIQSLILTSPLLPAVVWAWLSMVSRRISGVPSVNTNGTVSSTNTIVALTAKSFHLRSRIRSTNRTAG